MWSKIQKWFLKQLIPAPEDVAKLAAEAVASAVNSSDKGEQIAKYGELANKWTEYQAKLTKILVDGKIDEGEVEELKALALPIAEKVITGIKEAL